MTVFTACRHNVIGYCPICDTTRGQPDALGREPCTACDGGSFTDAVTGRKMKCWYCDGRGFVIVKERGTG